MVVPVQPTGWRDRRSGGVLRPGRLACRWWRFVIQPLQQGWPAWAAACPGRRAVDLHRRSQRPPPG